MSMSSSGSGNMELMERIDQIGKVYNGTLKETTAPSGVWTNVSEVEVPPGVYIATASIRIESSNVVQKICSIGLRAESKRYYDSRPSTPGNYFSISGTFKAINKSIIICEIFQQFGLDSNLNTFNFTVVKIA